MAKTKADVKRKNFTPRIRRKDYTGDQRFAGIPSKDRRDRHVHRRGDTVQNVSIKLEDHDKAVLYFFNEILKLKVMENGTKIDVPTLYGNPERWKSAQRDGFFRDKKEKIIVPLIMFRRNSISKNTALPVDKMNRNLVYTFEQKYTSHNKFDKFSLLNNIKPTRERHQVVIPDYVDLTYDCVIWTSYISQMNEIIEQLQYADDSFWGNPERFKFYTTIDSFDQQVEISTDTQRAVKTNFTINLRGYLIPESFNDVINTQRVWTTQQIIIQEETDVDLMGKSSVSGSTFIRQFGSNAQADELDEAALNELVDNRIQIAVNKYVTYLNDVSYQSGSFVETNANGVSVVTFTATSASVDDAAFETTKLDYLLFVNGQYVPHDSFDIQQSGSLFYTFLSTGSLGYFIEPDDEVIAWGKFQ